MLREVNQKRDPPIFYAPLIKIQQFALQLADFTAHQPHHFKCQLRRARQKLLEGAERDREQAGLNDGRGRHRRGFRIESAGEREHVAVLQKREDLLIALLVRPARLNEPVHHKINRLYLVSFPEYGHTPS
ncbi:hypothetical protein D3C74_233720 [compost metagenome]